MTCQRSTTPGRALVCALAFVAALIVASASRASAQDSVVTAARRGWVVGPLIGLPSLEGEVEPSLVTVGIGATRLVSNRPGVDVAFATAPRAVMEGLFVLHARVGAALPIALGSEAYVVPSVGLHGLGALGAGVGATGGYYGGLAVLIAGRSVGVRLGVTWLRIPDVEETASITELGLMRVPPPRVR